VAHESLSRPRPPRSSLVAILSVFLAACADAPKVAVAPLSPGGKPTQGEFPDEPRSLLRYRSLRFGLSLPLPDGHAWKIDDHKTGALIAEHAATRSTLTLQTFSEPEIMNRQKCEARVRDMGLVALRDPHTLEDLTTVGPEAYDSRVWVALETGASPSSPLSGHVFLFGAFVRKCLFAHYMTQVASEKEEPLLTTRLAVARLRILGGIEIVPFDQPPRVPEKP
jgi:hypothetical protein